LAQGIPQQSRTFPALLPSTPHFTLRTSTTTMLFSANILATFLVAAAVVASGSPVEPEKRQDTKVKFCEGRFWQEPCRVPDSVILEKCYEFRSEFGLTNIKSFGPPPGLTCSVFVCVTVPLLIFCRFTELFYSFSLWLRYRTSDCTQGQLGSIPLHQPGNDHISDLDQKLANGVSSFRCNTSIVSHAPFRCS